MATVFRKSGTSLWWTAYFDSHGRRRYRSTGMRTKSEAVATAAEMERQARRMTPGDSEQRRRILRIIEEAGDMALKGTLTQSSGTTLLNRLIEAATGEALQQAGIEEWFRGWLKTKGASCTKGTAERYGGVVETFLMSLPVTKRAMPLGALTVGDIQKFRDQQMTEGRTAATANLALKVLRVPLNLARRQGILQNNPAEAIEMAAGDGLEKGVFAPEQISRLLAVATNEWQGLILGGFYTGSRAGDLANLKWSSVDLKRNTIAFGQRKTKRFVEIPIHQAFGKWLAQVGAQEAGEFVFPSFAGKAIGSRSGLSQQFRALMKKAGITGKITEKSGDKGRSRSSLSFHSLRHSFNSAMANAGVSQELRQRLTGHASKAVNDRYTHTELETLRKAVGLVPSVP
ncbi:MAG TPA: site-specific integrase [Verrucomicrobiales bacterium]|nr:site-specific integrase [Verrucomicrobiales bacterium]